MHSIVFVIAGFAVTIIALLVFRRAASHDGRGFWGGGLLDNLTVSRDWLVHHRDDNHS